MSKIAFLFLATFAYGIYTTIAMGPVYGFYLYELIYFLNPDDRWWGGQIPGLPYSFITVLIMIMSFFLKKNKETNTLKEMPEFKWFVLILLNYGVVTVIAVDPITHNRFMEHLIKAYVVMYFAYRLLSSEKKLELALLVYILGAAYIGYEAMNAGRDGSGRVEGIGTVDAPEANGIACSIAPVIPLLLYFGWHGNLKVKIFILTCTVLVLNGLILINSRGSFLGVVAGFGYFFATMLFSKYKLPKQRVMILLVIIASVVTTIRLVDDVFIDRMLSLGNETTVKDEGSGSRRVHFWMATFDLLEDHPFGTGIYGYNVLSSRYIHDESMLAKVDGKSMRSVHSIWFQALSEIGWLGFGVFMMLLFSLYRHLKQSKEILIKHLQLRQYYLLIAIEGALITFFVAATFINMFRAEVLLWLLLFGISASVIVHRNHTSELHSPAPSKTRHSL